ncbi:interleukin-1 receptor type 2-like [Echeneis naucrates]|uniref:Interleukin-1 receptor type 2-like n=1 Tax=Echeneis naucrates TaxID=173247 RepID=A0A665VQ96_ECHNA|nr:interleukin-1 receptor type 2-like [Echeneis naucrates]XP_029386750.1 interleukin-1 receptor type 2-like [Echeneis naucrates]
MVHLALMLAVVIMEQVHGSQLPPLPMKDGCYLVSPEVEIFRQEGEAVILSFTMFRRTLTVRRIAPPTARFIITKDNGTEGEAFNGDNRVQQSNGQLWFLPAQASDSAQYVCTYRNESYCITGSIRLHVYESSSTDIQKMYYLINLTSGQKLRYKCPSLDYFNKTGSLIEWYKDSNSTVLQHGAFSSSSQDSGRLIIPAVKHSHAGLYTCQLRVLINNKQYKVSRTIQIRVRGPDSAVTTTVPDLSATSDPELNSSISIITTPVIPLLLIVSPLNGTIFESQHGSALELFCQVLTECQMSDSTAVTWLVNGQSVELSYLDGRALQGGRRVIKMSESCQIELKLIIVSVTEEDVRTELKCVAQNEGGRQEVVAQLRLEDSTFTWIVVAVVAVCCFLMVVSIFLYALFKPKRKKKADYILARQNSTF